MQNRTKVSLSILILLLVISSDLLAQTTEFIYQGQFQSGGTAANGNFDFEFSLFDAASGGSQAGSTLTRSGVSVANGIFSVNLDFGQVFPGANRFLEIRVRPAGGGAFTTLSPRQLVGSSPYSIRSLTANSADSAANVSNPLGGDVTGSFSNSTVARLRGRSLSANQPSNGQVLKFNATSGQWEPATDEIGSGTGNAILNQTTPQPNANFNISGNGTLGGILSAGTVNAAAQFNLGGQRVLSTSGVENTFLGIGAGTSATGASNSFFGNAAGAQNTTGSDNNFFGRNAGFSNTNGIGNVFLGSIAGNNNTSGSSNTMVGTGAGTLNGTGLELTLLGAQSNALDALRNSTAIGHRALVTSSNSIVLGSISGINSASADTNVGIGTTAPSQRLHVVGNGLITGNLNVTGTLTAPGFVVPAGSANYIQNTTLQQPASNFSISGNGVVAGNVGIGTQTPTQRLHVVGNSLFAGNSSFAGDVTVTGTLNATLPSGSTSYIQNTTSQQASSNFNVSGTGTATTFNSLNDFRIGGTRVLNIPGTQNTFVGPNAGVVNPSPSANSNSFFGFNAGSSLTTGSNNSFFGARAGELNATGSSNSFFGVNSGDANTGGSENSFFGHASGGGNTTGNQNSAFGRNAGQLNTTGNENAYFGFGAGQSATTSFNSFFGSKAGQFNTTGSSNSFFGASAGLGNNSGSDNSFFGVNAGVANQASSGNSYFGRRAGRDSLGANNTAVGIDAGRNNTTGSSNTFIGAGADAGAPNLTGATAIGAGATVNDNNEIVLGTESNFVRVKGVLYIPGSDGLDFRSNLVALGDTHVCLAGRTPPLTFSLTRCASSIRFKENVYSFGDGLRTLQKLRPVTYNWKSTGAPAIGLIAEEVNEVEPRLANREPDGTVFGVKFDSVTALTVSAVQEQQLQIEAQNSKIRAQQRQIEKQQAQIDELKTIVCSIKREAAICTPK